MNKTIAILGIHTDVGKTIVSSVLAESLGADYWKPVQAGDLENTDTMKVSNLVSNTNSVFHDEAYRLTDPVSPHESAARDGLQIDMRSVNWPRTDNLLIVETAGGVLSPLNGTRTMADFVVHYKLPVFLVVRHYLGSINHTLLCLEILKMRHVPLLGLILSGARNSASESFISNYSGLPFSLHIPELNPLTPETVRTVSKSIHDPLHLLMKKHGIS